MVWKFSASMLFHPLLAVYESQWIVRNYSWDRSNISFIKNSAPARQQRPTADNCKAVHAAYFERCSNKIGICRGFKRFNHFILTPTTHLTVDHLHHRMSMHFESALIIPQYSPLMGRQPSDQPNHHHVDDPPPIRHPICSHLLDS